MSAAVVRLDLPSEPLAVAVVRNALAAVAECGTVRLAAREFEEVALVVQEACTNVIRHAHKGDPNRRFQVELVRHAEALEVVLRDEGEPFDLTAVGPPPDPENLVEGGYGVHIIRTWMDEVTVSRSGGRNVLRLVRFYRCATAAHAEPGFARASLAEDDAGQEGAYGGAG